MLEFVIPFLLSLGFFTLIIFLTKEIHPEKKAIGLFIFSVGLIGVSFLLTITQFGVLTILKKIVGIIILITGFFLSIKFPKPDEHQLPVFSTFGLFIGFLLLFLGIYLTLF